MEPAPRRQQTTETLAKLYDGKLRLERRNGAPRIYARTFVQGKLVIKSTGEVTLPGAQKIATNWYLELLDRVRKGEQLHGRSFAEMADAFIAHADLVREVSEGQRAQYRIKWSVLKPHLADVKVTEIDSRLLLNLRETLSAKKTQRGTAVKPATLKKDLDFVRMVLRYAKNFEKCLDEIPEFPSFRGAAWEVVVTPRPFLNYQQWVTVRNLAKKRINEPGLPPRSKRQRQELYAFLLICVGAALRVGEAYSVRWCDCELGHLDDEKKSEALHMKVLGKHSRGGRREDAYGLYGAVTAFKALLKERRPGEEGGAKLEDPLFTENHRDGMKELLETAGLREAADGMTRDSKSLRQTGISMRLDRGDNLDYRDVAKWARTSPAMIASWYDQTHPKDSASRIVGFRKRE